ncbi:hypothetical protein CH373_13700 [Leptospira perolatii]|uniref:Uncharacterized protein n=1 Tax=Leptospira perolatii TaxID=2023191 RepID=A0A2M9ZK74_9LEPT|nr:hypothetical protein [Leptospira perolatii]PJZ69332.1 hypothetical protein CH360_11265 [Leptospira perolatii]PJZ72467.1 hypothetical protein CH373_13700 [Leptospira perolatii]
MTRTVSFLIPAVFLLQSLACFESGTPDKPDSATLALASFLEGTPTTECETLFDDSSAQIQPLCQPQAGTGKHYRLEGIRTTASHFTVYFYLGLASGLTGTTAPTPTQGEFRFTLYHGCPSGCGPSPIPPQSYANYGDNNNVNTTTTFDSFASIPSTVCVDVSENTPPRVTIWATGINGADCLQRSTLKASTSILDKSDWPNANPLNTRNAYVKRGSAGGTLVKAVVSSIPVL